MHCIKKVLSNQTQNSVSLAYLNHHHQDLRVWLVDGFEELLTHKKKLRSLEKSKKHTEFIQSVAITTIYLTEQYLKP